MSLQGTLKTLGITEVLEFLAARNATGQLDVTTEMGTATYLFSDGGIAQSEYSFTRERGSDSAEATYYVVSELDGTFFFDEDEEPIDIDNCEDVSSVLGRTADIAGQWHDVEASIPSPDDLLIRNEALDGSVTIQPEWWKALEVVGTGKTSLEVAEQLSMGVLDASLLLLAMTNAGLLKVKENDALEIEAAATGIAEDAPTVEDPSYELLDTPETPLDVEPLSMEAEAFAPIPAMEYVEPDAPIPAMEYVEPDAPTVQPLAEYTPASPATEPIPTAVPEQASIVESFEPAHQPPAVDPVVAAPVMYDIIEPVNDRPIAAPSELAAEAPAVPAAPAAAPVIDDDDGWASDHSPAYEAPAQASTFPAAPQAPVQNEALVEADHSLDHNAQNTAMAGEVLSDLATLSDQLGDAPSPQENWQLDGTFVAEEAPTVAAVDNDPFGDLGDLLSDTDEEDRGSVLKFLRRD